MKKEMLINCLQPEECRIAIVEDGRLEELYVERASQESYVNNIYKGRIVNVEPSIQAAFVDFGVGRNGFLHVSDVDISYYQHLMDPESRQSMIDAQEERAGGGSSRDRGPRPEQREPERGPRPERTPDRGPRPGPDRDRGPRPDRDRGPRPDRGGGRDAGRRDPKLPPNFVPYDVEDLPPEPVRPPSPAGTPPTSIVPEGFSRDFYEDEFGTGLVEGADAEPEQEPTPDSDTVLEGDEAQDGDEPAKPREVPPPVPLKDRKLRPTPKNNPLDNPPMGYEIPDGFGSGVLDDEPSPAVTIGGGVESAPAPPASGEVVTTDGFDFASDTPDDVRAEEAQAEARIEAIAEDAQTGEASPPVEGEKPKRRRPAAPKTRGKKTDEPPAEGDPVVETSAEETPVAEELPKPKRKPKKADEPEPVSEAPDEAKPKRKAPARKKKDDEPKPEGDSPAADERPRFMDGAERRTADDEDEPRVTGGGGFAFDPFAPNDRFADDAPDPAKPKRPRAERKPKREEPEDESGESDDMVSEDDGAATLDLPPQQIIYDDVIVEGADLPEGSYIEEVIEEEFDPATGETIQRAPAGEVPPIPASAFELGLDEPDDPSEFGPPRRNDRDRNDRGGRPDRGGRSDRGGPPRSGGYGDRPQRSGSSFGGGGGSRDFKPKPPPIEQIFKKGQEVIVQVIKEGIGTKGPTLSTCISIAGRYLVLVPWLGRLAVSRKIEDGPSRGRLKDALRELNPPEGIGFIIRTAAVDRQKRELQNDLGFLVRIWEVFCRRVKKASGPLEVYRESDMITRTIRDNFTPDIDAIHIDDADAHAQAADFLNVIMPRYADRLKRHDTPEPIFHRFGIEDEIARIQHKVVPLSNGGSIVIEQTEALVSIDVNSGTFRSESNAEDTAYQVNMAAAKEIARQLRLRDLGGVIANDFIDMRQESHRRTVEKTLRDAMARDKARTKILRTSQFGVIEMTRQRIRPSLRKSIYSECSHCRGSGFVKSAESMAIELMRLVQMAASRKVARQLNLKVSLDVAAYMLNRKRRELLAWEDAGEMQVTVTASAGFGPEQAEINGFDAQGNELRFALPEPPKVGRQHREVKALTNGEEREERPSFGGGGAPRDDRGPPRDRDRGPGGDRGGFRPRDDRGPPRGGNGGNRGGRR